MRAASNPALPPVVVLRSNDICFLGILRCCRDAGLETVSIIFDWPQAPVWYSSHSDCLGERHQIPNPYTDADGAAESLRKILAELYSRYGEKLMVLPSSDTNLMFVMDYFHLFGEYIRIMGGRSFESPRRDVVHKHACATLLAETEPGLAPRTLRCRNTGDIEMILDDIIYPAIYKPAVKDYGQEFYRAHNGSKAIECADPSELRLGLEQEMEAGFDLVGADAAIVPVMLYDAKLSQEMADALLKEGIYVIGFFFPVVPKTWVLLHLLDEKYC